MFSDMTKNGSAGNPDDNPSLTEQDVATEADAQEQAFALADVVAVHIVGQKCVNLGETLSRKRR